MIKFFKTVYLFTLFILTMQCTGTIDSIKEELYIPFYGTWIYKHYQSNTDSLIMISSFSYPNKFEDSQFISFGSNYTDTIYRSGSYQIPSPNLIFMLISTITRVDSTYSMINAIDTILYQFNAEELLLCFGVVLYKQISGRENELLNGEFYKVIRISEARYYHELYHFEKDTLYHYWIYTNSVDIPTNWFNYEKFKYLITDIFIFLENGASNLWKGYKFYNGDLLLSLRPRVFKKYCQKNYQPNSY